ncbi:glycoside hydrolase family 97 protein [bacterium]|nr:glycoside hydrolase family 97 protein [bacterium]
MTTFSSSATNLDTTMQEDRSTPQDNNQSQMKTSISFFLFAILAIVTVASAWGGEVLRSPDGRIEVALDQRDGSLFYSVDFNGEQIVSSSQLGLKASPDATLEIVEVTRSEGDQKWESVWGIRKVHHDHFNAIEFTVAGDSAQTISFRAYNDGIAFRYALPRDATFKSKSYAHEASEISFVSAKPTAWFPLTPVLGSDATDLNSWQDMKKDGKLGRNARYEGKPPVIRTPLTLKLSQKIYLSIHEAAVVQSNVAGLRLEGKTLTYNSSPASNGGRKTPWRTVVITNRPGGLLESSLSVNLNEPSKIEDTSWIKPGVTMWDWRNHGGHADDGFEYHLNTESYLRYINFAAQAGVEYVLIDAEWYGPERDTKSDPKTAIDAIDIEKICRYAEEKGVGIWLYINTIALKRFDMDATFQQYQKWGVKGIKQGFGGAGVADLEVVAKCAKYKLMYVRHESQKPTGVQRTFPNILSYEYVNSMLDSATRPSATPSRVINGLFIFGAAGPVDRSCGLFDLDSYIAREKCHRQIPATVVSQAAQCLLYPSGLLTLPDIPDAYLRKADLFEFIAQLPMNWDQTKVLDAEIGKHITLARQSGDQWFVGSLTDEEGRHADIKLDFLQEGVDYDVTLYQDAPDAHYEYFGPMNKREARIKKQKLEPRKTRRELYEVKKITAKKNDIVNAVLAPGGGHCMWIRPVE